MRRNNEVGERYTEMDKQRTTRIIDADDNTGDEIESSRCNHADGPKQTRKWWTLKLMKKGTKELFTSLGYIEFYDPINVSITVDLSGQLLLGQPIEVKPLNVGNPAAEERSFIHTGKKNFLDKPWDVMTSDERIDASTNWRELTDIENRRFFYNKLTGDRSWSLPLELVVARNRAHFAAQSSPFSTQHVPFTPFVAHSNCQQVPLLVR